jgi:hypothetical protein
MSLPVMGTVIDMPDGSLILQAASFDLTDGTLLSTIPDSWHDPETKCCTWNTLHLMDLPSQHRKLPSDLGN